MSLPSLSEKSSLDIPETEAMLEKKQVVAKTRSQLKRFFGGLKRLRWPVLFIMQACVLVSLHREQNNECPAEPGHDLNHIAPRLSRYPYEFRNEIDQFTPNYTSEASTIEVRNEWEKLFPKGGGLVYVDQPEKYDYLGTPIKPVRQGDFGPLYMVSWVHQLHCLYFLMNAYDTVLQRGPSGMETHVPVGHETVHSRHCVDYLMQAILCNSDMTLEGSVHGHEAGTNGYGETHVCRSHEESMSWIESRRPWDSRDFIDLHEGGEV